MKNIEHKIKLLFFKKKYRKNNKHNFTVANSIFDIAKVKVGNFTYGVLNVNDFSLKEEKLKIGNYCSIADNVLFILSGEHPYKKVSTYSFATKILHDKNDCFCKGPIIIEDDVWIGQNCTILSGVTIGQGAIIGAGTVVAKDVPPYAIFANGRIIKYRFSEDMIEKLIKIDYSKLTEGKIKKNIELLNTDITEDNVDNIIKMIEE